MEERTKHHAIATTATTAAAHRGVGTASIPTRRSAAIDVLTRALRSPPSTIVTDKSDSNAKAKHNAASEASSAAARSFLDQTCSVYVLDADTSSSISGSTSPSSAITSATGASLNHPTNHLVAGTHNPTVSSSATHNMPKIFGCWNFLHQAMNEIERFENEEHHLSLLRQREQKLPTLPGPSSPPRLLSETRLLAEFAVKVARRSDDLDRQKVTTCVDNFCSSRTSSPAAAASRNESKDTSDSENSPDRNPRRPGDASAASSGHNHRDINILLPHLIDANAQIREIVTGRIAAFSFNHNQHIQLPLLSAESPAATATTATTRTAFEDPVVVETFCKFLAANAVSNGPERLRRFLEDWIIPGATADAAITTPEPPVQGGVAKRQKVSPGGTKRPLHDRLPPYSLACVLYHVAAESSAVAVGSPLETTNTSTISPPGTIDVLQRLSLQVMANVLLGPVLHDALKRTQLKRQLKHHRQQQQQQQQQSQHDSDGDDEDDDMDDMIVAMGLRAIFKWCTTTDLSLAQTKHIGSKVRINLSILLGEALKTDSPRVMNALADLVEDVVDRHVVPEEPRSRSHLIREARMTQTRYLMQVPDEASFRANVSQEQLHTIETKELTDMLEHLSADVEGQRFRFPSFGEVSHQTPVVQGNSAQRPPNEEILLDERRHSLGHSLARIAAAVCSGYAKVTHGDIPPSSGVTPEPYRIPGPGLLELLSKCASHPSAAICGIVLPVVTPVLNTQVTLANTWLPTLQRRAIIPHHPNNSAILSSSKIDSGDEPDPSSDPTNQRYPPLLSASDVCFVEFEEFVDSFRETVLADALNACYSIHSEFYLASCTAAIEEFCVGENATEQTSFHLEAALFCLAVVAEQVLPSALHSGRAASIATQRTKINANASSYLLRCTNALTRKPRSLNNPLTMAQACRFVRKYAKWFGAKQDLGILDTAADLILFILSQCATGFPDAPLSSTIQRETGLTPYSEAAKALRYLLCHNANHFLSNPAIAALGAGWEATFTACNRGGKLLTLEDRKDTCIGICHVLAALPKDQQQTSLMALALASIACLEAMVERTNSMASTEEKALLPPLLERAADEIIILVTIARAFTDALSTINLGIGSVRTSFVESSMMVLRRAWPTISIVTSKYGSHDSILASLKLLFIECMPSKIKSNSSLILLQNICALAETVIKNENARQKNNEFFSPVLNFIDRFIGIHGSTFERIVLSKQAPRGEEDPNRLPPYSEKDGRMYKCLDSLTRDTINAMKSQHLLGRTWTSVQEQGNGQSAFESKTKLQYSSADFCNVGLAPLFSFLRTCAKQCPTFLLHILAGGADGSDATDLPMLRKALYSAVSSIIGAEAEISIQAIAFLESVVPLRSQFATNNTNDDNAIVGNTVLRKFSREFNINFQTDMLSTILRGMCGMLQPVVVPHASRLLFSALSTLRLSPAELKLVVVRGLKEHFFLGNRAWCVIYDFCLQFLRAGRTDADGSVLLDELENMMADVWQLHRFENLDTIERSDVVHAFCVQYGRKKIQFKL